MKPPSLKHNKMVTFPFPRVHDPHLLVPCPSHWELCMHEHTLPLCSAVAAWGLPGTALPFHLWSWRQIPAPVFSCCVPGDICYNSQNMLAVKRCPITLSPINRTKNTPSGDDVRECLCFPVSSISRPAADTLLVAFHL